MIEAVILPFCCVGSIEPHRSQGHQQELWFKWWLNMVLVAFASSSGVRGSARVISSLGAPPVEGGHNSHSHPVYVVNWHEPGYRRLKRRAQCTQDAFSENGTSVNLSKTEHGR